METPPHPPYGGVLRAPQVTGEQVAVAKGPWPSQTAALLSSSDACSPAPTNFFPRLAAEASPPSPVLPPSRAILCDRTDIRGSASAKRLCTGDKLLCTIRVASAICSSALSSKADVKSGHLCFIGSAPRLLVSD